MTSLVTQTPETARQAAQQRNRVENRAYAEAAAGGCVNSLSPAAVITQEKPCYAELLERIAAIWHAVCEWICDLANRLFSTAKLVETLPIAQPDIAQSSPDAFRMALAYLEPKDIARAEAVCKIWRSNICTEDQQVWRRQCAHYSVTSCPVSGRYKEVFQVPKRAFGPREWVRYGWGEPGPMPILPKDTAKLIRTHTLTLIPAFVNGQPLSLHTFTPLLEKSNVYLSNEDGSRKSDNEAQDRSIWVWMQKEVEPGSTNKTQEQVEKEYPQKLGKALWITVSTVAHYVRYKLSLFQGTFTRVRDSGEDVRGVWYLVIGGFIGHRLQFVHHHSVSEILGVAQTFPAET